MYTKAQIKQYKTWWYFPSSSSLRRDCTARRSCLNLSLETLMGHEKLPITSSSLLFVSFLFLLFAKSNLSTDHPREGIFYLCHVLFQLFMAPLTLYAYDMCGLHKQVFFFGNATWWPICQNYRFIMGFFLGMPTSGNGLGRPYLHTNAWKRFHSFFSLTYVHSNQTKKYEKSILLGHSCLFNILLCIFQLFGSFLFSLTMKSTIEPK